MQTTTIFNMKNTLCLLLVFLVWNVSFSQEKTENNSVKNENIKASIFTFYPNPLEDVLFVLSTQKN